MAALLTRVIAVAWCAALAALLSRGTRHGWTAGVWLGLFALFLLHPTVLAVEGLLSLVIGRRDAKVAVRAGDFLRAWYGEWLASTILFCWSLPWRSDAIEDHLPKTARGVRGVVLIHGLVCNRSIWNSWLLRLRKLDRAFVAVNLEPVFGDIDAYAPQVERAVRRIESVTGLAPIIVAHSMGGLVARAWLRTRRAQAPGDTQDDVARVITIGTPHRGTWFARFSLSRSGPQMPLGGEWISALRDAEPAHLAESFTCWWSACDQLVFPPTAAVLPGSESRQLRGVGHVAMTRREEIWNELRRRLDA